jgi:hypothetical protein
MKRTHLIAVVVGFMASVMLAQDAFGRARMYNPRLGQFMQRDPLGTPVAPALAVSPEPIERSMSSAIYTRRDPQPAVQYADGMNLYQVVCTKCVAEGLRIPTPSRSHSAIAKWRMVSVERGRNRMMSGRILLPPGSSTMGVQHATRLQMLRLLSASRGIHTLQHPTLTNHTAMGIIASPVLSARWPTAASNPTGCPTGMPGTGLATARNGNGSGGLEVQPRSVWSGRCFLAISMTRKLRQQQSSCGLLSLTDEAEHV